MVFQNILHRDDFRHLAAIGLTLGLAAPENALGLEADDHTGRHRFLLDQRDNDSALPAPI